MSAQLVFAPEEMKRHVLIYGLLGGILITILQWVQYRFLVIEYSLEIYGGLIAATFAILGIWLGLRLTKRQQSLAEGVRPEEHFAPDTRKQEDFGITPRELGILRLIAQGMSNREIAEKLFVSENTVKTHSSRVFAKLGGPAADSGRTDGQRIRIAPVIGSPERTIFFFRT